MESGTQLPSLRVPPPGPASRELAVRLRAVESRNVTYLDESFPVFWEEALGANVRDADGNVYLDLTAAFGVALLGHRAPSVTGALARQAARLVHGMGDVHPTAVKVELLERLAGLLPWPEVRAVLASTGSEAVEVALKTAHMVTGRPGIVAFEGGYHGLTLGALATTGRPYFRTPFQERIYAGVARVPFPAEVDSDEAAQHPERRPEAVLDALEDVLRRGAPNGDPVGAVIVEPVQARAGVRVMPGGFGRALSEVARRHGAILIADEVFTGLGRCGAVLASSRLGMEPDLVCLGKVLGGGLPLSACAGPAEVMDAWPQSPGEALHTSTFLGHPLACATGCAVLEAVADGLPERAEALGARLAARLSRVLEPAVSVRGLGLLLGTELRGGAGHSAKGIGARVAALALAEGVLVLPAGEVGEVVEVTPPVCLTDEQEECAAQRLSAAWRDVARQRV